MSCSTEGQSTPAHSHFACPNHSQSDTNQVVEKHKENGISDPTSDKEAQETALNASSQHDESTAAKAQIMDEVGSVVNFDSSSAATQSELARKPLSTTDSRPISPSSQTRQVKQPKAMARITNDKSIDNQNAQAKELKKAQANKISRSSSQNSTATLSPCKKTSKPTKQSSAITMDNGFVRSTKKALQSSSITDSSKKRKATHELSARSPIPKSSPCFKKGKTSQKRIPLGLTSRHVNQSLVPTMSPLKSPSMSRKRSILPVAHGSATPSKIRIKHLNTSPIRPNPIKSAALTPSPVSSSTISKATESFNIAFRKLQRERADKKAEKVADPFQSLKKGPEKTVRKRSKIQVDARKKTKTKKIDARKARQPKLTVKMLDEWQIRHTYPYAGSPNQSRIASRDGDETVEEATDSEPLLDPEPYCFVMPKLAHKVRMQNSHNAGLLVIPEVLKQQCTVEGLIATYGFAVLGVNNLNNTLPEWDKRIRSDLVATCLWEAASKKGLKTVSGRMSFIQRKMAGFEGLGLLAWAYEFERFVIKAKREY